MQRTLEPLDLVDSSRRPRPVRQSAHTRPGEAHQTHPPHTSTTSSLTIIMSVNRPTTPLRRVSRGSISALSQSRGASSTPLSFLEGPLGNLADETSILSSNLEDLASIHDALSTFNEGFAMFLYGLKVAAYCIEWSEAPQEDNFARAREAQGERATRTACFR